MCSGIQCVAVDFLQSTTTAVFTQAQNAVFELQKCGTWLDRTIVDITRKILPHCAAVAAAAMIKSIPFIAMRLFLPMPLFLIGIGAIVVYKTVCTPKGEPITAKTVENGFAFGELWIGGNQIAEGIVTNNIPTLIFGIGNIVASCFMFLRTDLVKEICTDSTPLIEAEIPPPVGITSEVIDP
jgi:hypothetical protein